MMSEDLRVRAVTAVVLAAALVVGQLVTPASADGLSWSAVPAAEESRQWYSVAYGNGVWVAVARTEEVMRSTDDGVTWASATAPQANLWSSVAYGDGVWVAVAESGEVMRSTDDGVTWALVTVPQATSWSSVAYGGGVWVAVAFSGEVMRSTDGEKWTSVTVEQNSWTSVAYGTDTNGDGVWIAVAFEIGPGGTEKGMRSTDGGAGWEPVAALSDYWYSVAYGDGVWIAVDGFNGMVMRSEDDGDTWDSVTAPAAPRWLSVAYGNGVWVAVASYGAGIMRSTDNGLTWESVNPPSANNWWAVAYGDGVWVAVANDGTNQVMRSGARIATPAPTAASAPLSSPSLSCTPGPLSVGATVVCTVTGGAPGIDILWRATGDSLIAEAGVNLDGAGAGEFSFRVPAAALGEELTVELVEWLAPFSLGVVGGPVPAAVPAGEGGVPAPSWSIALLTLLVGVGLLRRGMRAED